jgi:hypothetical protein
MMSSQSVKALRPLKGQIIVHEHDFITTRIKEANSFLIQCITCGICYCDLCGKALGDKVTNLFSIHRQQA